MMEKGKYEAAAKWIETHYVTNENSADANALRLAVKALRRMEPKRPTHEATLYRCYTCPSCKNVIDEFLDYNGRRVMVEENVCKYCGQALDWGED